MSDYYCKDCEFLNDKSKGNFIDGYCKKYNQSLTFYDWFEKCDKCVIETLQEENAALRERLEKAVDEKNKWFSVKECLPETDNKNTHDFDVLVYVPKRDGCNQYGIYIGKLLHVEADDGTRNFFGIETQACDWTIWGWGYLEHPVVTHWKPLPAFPIEAEARLAELKGEKK